MSEELKPCPFCGGECDPDGWLGGDGTRGPECNDCGATARTVEDWNRRTPDFKQGLLRAAEICEAQSPRHTECGNRIAMAIRAEAEKEGK